ncbi:MAG: hypothetical protein CVU78_00235 [Elusimicrobia bacterium HGW-Elusimicrobia-2]|nr:MAG: hypothetical protein CVU78_00235 [Elusimicrobia bacterium HGW-Elusimicrobia-2]
MGWKEFFKGLITNNVDAKIADSIQKGDGNTFNNCNVVINCQSSQSVMSENGKTIINPEKLSQDDRNILNTLLKDSAKESVKGEPIFLTTKDNDWAEDIKKKDSEPDVQAILKFYQNKISSVDLIILRQAMYIKKVFLEHRNQEVRDMKRDIRDKYGKRGANITNLCTAGYYEKDFKEMYEALSKIYTTEDKIKTKFLSLYDPYVDDLPCSVFVSFEMKEEDIEKEILTRLKYGIDYIKVHGIGTGNVKRIKKVILAIEEKTSMEKNIIDDNNVITAELKFTMSENDK